MKRDWKKLHVLTSVLFILTMLVLLFTTDNPLILTAEFILIFTILSGCGGISEMKNGFRLFVPFALVTIIINMIFSSGGKIVVFEALGKIFTLESFIYASVLSFKLLNVVLVFNVLKHMIDSDKAVAYFSKIMPKSTLMMMIGFKFIPGMKARLQGLREVYRMRGVSFEGRNLKERAFKYIPMLSILMEASLEGAFDIGEAAYTRGFLSGNRTVYDKQEFSKSDWVIIFFLMLLLMVYMFMEISGYLSFDIYSGISSSLFLNPASIIFIALITCLNFILILTAKEI